MLADESEKLVRNPAAVIRLMPGSPIPYLRSQVEKPFCQTAVSFYKGEVTFAKFDSPFSSANCRTSLDEIAVTVNHPNENTKPVVVVLRPKNCMRRSLHSEPFPPRAHLGYHNNVGEYLLNTRESHGNEDAALFRRQLQAPPPGWCFSPPIPMLKRIVGRFASALLYFAETGMRCPWPLFFVTKSSSLACLFAISSLTRERVLVSLTLLRR